MKRAVVMMSLVLGCSATSPAPAEQPGAGQPGAEQPTAVSPEPTTPVDPDAADRPNQPTAPTKPTSPTAASSLSAEMQTVLDEHNRRRSQHCAPALSWSPEVAQVAQGWADHLRDAGCLFEHSKGGKLGENLAAGSEGALDAKGVVDMWYREVMMYDWSHPTFSMETGHFSQVVWVGTTKLGCGVAQCKGTSIWVCNYGPPGNMQGAFEANVKLKGCR